NLAGDGGDNTGEISNPGYRGPLAGNQCPSFGSTYQVFVCRNGEPRRDARLLVDELACAGLKSDLFHQILQQTVHFDRGALLGGNTRFLEGDLPGNLDALRVVGQYLAFDPVLERRDDGATVGIILGVGRKYELDIEWQTQLEAPNLDIFLL